MNKKELKELLNEGVPGYNKVVYHYIAKKDFKNAHKYANKKMDLILEDGLIMEDEDLSLVAYTFVMNEDYESSKNSIQVLYDDGDVMVDESHLDLYGSLGLALCYKMKGNKEKAEQLLKQASSFKPNEKHLGADEVLLEQAKELMNK